MSKGKGGGIQAVKPASLLLGESRRIRGINSHPDDLKILGSPFRAAVTDAIKAPGITVTRSIDEATFLTIPIGDYDGELRESELLQAAFTLELDGLFFRHAGVDREDDGTLTLRPRSREVAKLMRQKGPAKVTRGKWTRAEFIYSRVREIRPRIPFFCPELHVDQPIRSVRQAREDDVGRGDGMSRDDRREPGLDRDANLTVKGVKATPEQIALADTMMRTAVSHGADDEILTGLITATINESLIQNLTGGLADSSGPLQVQASDHPGLDPRDPVAITIVFVTEGFTGAGSALELSKRLPIEQWLGKVMWMYNATTYPGNQYIPEAEKWVEAFKGGKIASEATSVEVTKKYAFEQGENENTWTMMKRLGDEVNWRRFEAAGIVYYIAETDLLASRPQMRVSEDAAGIDGISWRYDSPRKAQEVTVTCRAKAWAAPPGSCAIVSGEGQGNGRYIVSQIESVLGDETATVTLRRPTPPLPEPAPETTTKTIGGFGGGGGADLVADGDAPEAALKMAEEVERLTKLGLSYVFGGGHATPAPANGPFDCSSFVSRVGQVGGVMDVTMATGALASWGESGEGKYFTVYVHNGGPGGGHTLLKIGDRYAECGGSDNPDPAGGPSWIEPSPGRLSGFESVRHARGL